MHHNLEIFPEVDLRLQREIVNDSVGARAAINRRQVKRCSAVYRNVGSSTGHPIRLIYHLYAGYGSCSKKNRLARAQEEVANRQCVGSRNNKRVRGTSRVTYIIIRGD